MRVTMRRILSATELSAPSLQAVAHGISLAREFQAHLLVCHCIDLPAPSIYGEAYLAPEEQVNRNIAYAQKCLAEMMEGQEVAWEPLVSVGYAADEIARLAREQGVDMALTATRGEIVRSRQEEHRSFVCRRNIIYEKGAPPLGGNWNLDEVAAVGDPPYVAWIRRRYLAIVGGGQRRATVQ